MAWQDKQNSHSIPGLFLMEWILHCVAHHILIRSRYMFSFRWKTWQTVATKRIPPIFDDRLCSFNGPHTILRLPHMKLAEIMELMRKKYYELLRRGWKQGFHQKIVPIWGHGSKWDILCGIDKLGDSQFLTYIYLLIFLFIQTLTVSLISLHGWWRYSTFFPLRKQAISLRAQPMIF